MRDVITRRDLLKAALGGIATLSASNLVEGQQKTKRSKVVLIRHPDVLDKSGRINTKVLQEMLDEAIMALVGVKDPIEAWRKLVKPTDLVGIKTNVWAYLPTPKEVEEAIQRRLIDAGVKPERILINDRQAHTVLAPCTALINVRPVRTHWWSGIGGCIKNYIMFVTNPSDYHTDAVHLWVQFGTCPLSRAKRGSISCLPSRPSFTVAVRTTMTRAMSGNTKASLSPLTQWLLTRLD